MSEEARAFLTAIERLPKKQFPATHTVNAIFKRIVLSLETRLPPHLIPLTIRLHAFCARHVFRLEKRLHINPTFRLLLGLRIVPPGLAFMAAAASTVYILRYLYTHALDLLTNIIGVAYPAYQSMMAIEYGDATALNAAADFSQSLPKDQQQTLDKKALGIAEPSLDKKQWLMYWTIYGVLTTADHWAGSILRLFPMYRVAKIGILVWAQHRKYNGATWLYDTFIKPLLPPSSVQKTTRAQNSARTDSLSASGMPSHSLDLQITEACSGSSLADTEDSSDDDAEANEVASDNAGMHKSYSALVMPSVWGSAASNVGPTSKQEAVIAALSRTA